MDGLTSGRIVHYVDRLVTAPDKKVIVPAMVSYVFQGDKGEVTLHVFSMNSSQPIKVVNATYEDAEDQTVGTWHWIPKV